MLKINNILLLWISLSLFLITDLSFDKNNIFAQQEQQQQQQLQLTKQGAPVAVIPGITGNVLSTVSFLIGTSSFILGLKIQNVVKTFKSRDPTKDTTIINYPLDKVNKYYEILILALVIPAIMTNIFGIMVVENHLYAEEKSYLLIFYVLFIPIGAILFLVKKLHLVNNI